MTTIYAGLEKYALFTKDQKIPFQWIQPGNTGNTGGGSGKPHGTTIWTPTATGTVIQFDPKPNYDTGDHYMVLPYPTQPPKRLRTTCGNWSALTPADWAKSQQMEGPVAEYVGQGYQYTCAWACNPKDGLRYWAGAQKWQSLKNVTVSLANPIFWVYECSLDALRHTFTYKWLVINGQKIDVNIEVPAVLHPSKQEYSIAVQMDGNKVGDAYSALLSNLVTEWE